MVDIWGQVLRGVTSSLRRLSIFGDGDDDVEVIRAKEVIARALVVQTNELILVNGAPTYTYDTVVYVRTGAELARVRVIFEDRYVTLTGTAAIASADPPRRETLRLRDPSADDLVEGICALLAESLRTTVIQYLRLSAELRGEFTEPASIKSRQDQPLQIGHRGLRVVKV